MAPIGFSTGTLAHGNFRHGIQMLRGKQALAIELSALREHELPRLIEYINDPDLNQFSYISVHAPSRLETMTEQTLVDHLGIIFEKNWPVIVHPDIIIDFSIWKPFKDLVCIENMDKRKTTGRTAMELQSIFDHLPDASLCFDIGHARQIDPTMFEALQIINQHRSRIKQLHISEVNSSSRHEPINRMAEIAYKHVFNLTRELIPENTPIILESPVTEDLISSEINKVVKLLSA